jgi:hypothetical protein
LRDKEIERNAKLITTDIRHTNTEREEREKETRQKHDKET